MLLGLIPVLLPSMIHLAEGIFSKTDDAPKGLEKKAFVMDFLGKLFDYFNAKGDVPHFLSRDFFLQAMSMLIDATVPQLVK